MEIIRGVPEKGNGGREPIVAVGNFDGVHLGHRAILGSVVRRAEAAGGTATALTFDPHPVRVLTPGRPFDLLTSTEEKARLLAGLGLDRMMIIPFTREFAGQRPAEFVETILHIGVGAREVYVGRNFAFGRGREGTAEDLKRIAESFGMAVSIIEPVAVKGTMVSSSRIRALLLDGEVRAAAGLLGRSYEIAGVVVGGERRGRLIGYPTANLRPPEQLVPKPGVYAVGVYQGDDHGSGGTLAAIGYIGSRPTFGSGEALIEIHLFGYEGDLYRKRLRVAFLERVRDEMVFSGAEELSRQIQLDIEKAHQIHETIRKTAGSKIG